MNFYNCVGSFRGEHNFEDIVFLRYSCFVFVEGNIHLEVPFGTKPDGIGNIDGCHFVDEIYTASVEADFVKVVIDIGIIICSKEMDRCVVFTLKSRNDIAIRLQNFCRQFLCMILAVIYKEFCIVRFTDTVRIVQNTISDRLPFVSILTLGK